MKISKNTLLLGGAILLGILCFVGAQYYLRSYLSRAEEKLAGQYTAKKVIVASADIESGGIITADNVAVREIPERYLSSNVLTPDDFDAVSGQKVVTTLKPGDPIDRGALERVDRAPFSTTIAKGERAITFPVDDISSISGMLVPGDMIDLMYTGPGLTTNSYAPRPGDAPGPKELLHVRPIMQAVPVLATGKMTQKRVVKTEGGGEREVNLDFTTVTLKVNPTQAEQILIAQKLGTLTAVLRNADDSTPDKLAELDETRFKQVAQAPVGAAAARGDYVEIITGGVGNGSAQVSQTEVGKSVLGGLFGAAARPAAPARAPDPSAYDVKSRLGLNPAPAAVRPDAANVGFGRSGESSTRQ